MFNATPENIYAAIITLLVNQHLEKNPGKSVADAFELVLGEIRSNKDRLERRKLDANQESSRT